MAWTLGQLQRVLVENNLYIDRAASNRGAREWSVWLGEAGGYGPWEGKGRTLEGAIRAALDAYREATR